MSLSILPLAIAMMAGPQIRSAILFATTKRPVNCIPRSPAANRLPARKEAAEIGERSHK